jgi:hypothetical protein
VLITKGGVGVGYRFFNEIFYGTKIVQNKKKSVTCAINDQICLEDKCSEFLYQPIDIVEAFAMRKPHFINVMKHTFAKMLLPKIAKRYKQII